MRRALSVLTVVLFFSGQANAAGWPSWLSFRGHGAGYAAPECPGCYEESPLYPQITHWTFEKTQCKQPLCMEHKRKGCEVPMFPPLPYGHQGVMPHAQGQSSPWGMP